MPNGAKPFGTNGSVNAPAGSDAGLNAPSNTSTRPRSEEHTSELQSPCNLVCRLLLEKKKRPVSSWKALNLQKTLLMASSFRLKPLQCSRLPGVPAQETLPFLRTQKQTCVYTDTHRH